MSYFFNIEFMDAAENYFLSIELMDAAENS
jgi:hypothetical protein